MKTDKNGAWLVIILFSLMAAADLMAREPVSDGITLLISPVSLRPEMRFTLVVVSEEEIVDEELEIFFRKDEEENIKLDLVKKGGGLPFWSWWQGRTGRTGWYLLEIRVNKKQVYSNRIQVAETTPEKKNSPVFWNTEKNWNRKQENLYSAWLEALFLEADEKDSWPDLNSVLNNPESNFLHNHLGLGEDWALSLKPDCADNPFFLRAYFAWKNLLPFGFHQCSRGSLAQAPTTGRWFHNELSGGPGNEIKKFFRLISLVMDTVHSGTARTRLTDENSDYYPLPLSRKSLRPGSVYADPYGHTLIIIRWIPQTESRPGILLAMDAQPDGTVGIKRFWEGNFLFATDEVVGQPGFKAFRPVLKTSGELRLMTNLKIQESPDYGNYSLEQHRLRPDLFYQKMERLINPQPLDPEAALKDLYSAFYEQLLVRVESVENGERYMREHPGQIISMPSGAAVFLATGAWEKFSTPNRDLRLLVAMDTIEEFLEKVSSHPERYRIKSPESPERVKSLLENLSRRLGEELFITYRRSDGRTENLTLGEILKRKEAFEMGYNPNDCVEIRWGAPAGSEEISACRRRAPVSQQKKMEKLRTWFRKRLHPPT